MKRIFKRILGGIIVWHFVGIAIGLSCAHTSDPIGVVYVAGMIATGAFFLLIGLLGLGLFLLFGGGE